MLVLSRAIDEKIMVSDNIVITVVDIRGDKVRLGVDAPKDVPVHREEVYDAIKRSEAEQKKQKEVARPDIESIKDPRAGYAWPDDDHPDVVAFDL